MNTRLISSLIAICFVTFWASPVAGAVSENIGGDWVGGSNLFGNPVFISFSFTESPAGTQGTTNIQSWRVSNRPLTKVEVDGSRLHFEFPSTTGIPFVGDGEIRAGVIEGTIHRGEQQGKFHLVRVANIDRKLLDKYVGAFRFEDPQAPDKNQLGLQKVVSVYMGWSTKGPLAVELVASCCRLRSIQSFVENQGSRAHFVWCGRPVHTE